VSNELEALFPKVLPKPGKKESDEKTLKVNKPQKVQKVTKCKFRTSKFSWLIFVCQQTLLEGKRQQNCSIALGRLGQKGLSQEIIVQAILTSNTELLTPDVLEVGFDVYGSILTHLIRLTICYRCLLILPPRQTSLKWCGILSSTFFIHLPESFSF
jgi:hypothetical protein